MLVRQLSLNALGWANLDDARRRLADHLRRLLLAYLTIAINSHLDGVLDLTECALLHNLGLARLQLRVHADLGLEWSLLDPFDIRRYWLGLFRLRTDADDCVGRLLGALSGHGRVAGRLTVNDLLSGSYKLSTQLALLIDNLLTSLQIRIEDDLGLERNRLLQLGHNLAVISLRAVLDDLLNRLLRHLLGGVHRGGVVLCSEVGGEFLLAVFTLLNNLHLTRLQLRVHPHDRVVRKRRSPRCLVGRLSRFGADSDDLLHRLLDDLLGDLRVARLGVDDVSLDRHLLLARLTFLSDLGLARLQARVVDDLHIVRNLSLNRLSVRAGGLGANADLLRCWFLGALRGHGRVAGRLTVDNLLGRGHNLGSELALLVDDLLAGRQVGIKLNLGLKRNRLLSLGHQLARSKARTIFNDALDRLLGSLFLNYLGLVALGGELSGVGLLTVLAFLNNSGFTRLQLRVLANLSRVRDRHRPGHVLGALGRLGADNDNFIDRLRGAFPATVLVLLLRARLAFGLNPVLAGGDGVVVLVLDVERNLARRNVNNVHHSVSGIRRAVLVGHGNRNLDLVTWLRILRCGCGDLAIVVNADVPTGRNITQLVWVFLSDVDVLRLVESDRQRSGLARVHRLNRVSRLRLPIVCQLHHGGNRHLRGGAIRGFNRDADGLLITRFRIRRWGGGHDTSARVDLVLPAVDVLLGDRRTIIILAKGELRSLRGILDMVLYRLVRAGDLNIIGRCNVAL